MELIEITDENVLQLQNVILKTLRLNPLPYTLEKKQLFAICKFIYDNNSISCFLPTSFGKTIIALLSAIYMWKEQKKKTILIGLLKALTKEQSEEFGKYLPTLLDDGDHDTITNDYVEKKWAVACMTPEKFDGILSNGEKRDIVMENVGLIITDEAHTIGDSSRGDVMENYIITCKVLYPQLRYISLSATVGNPDEFAAWLESSLVHAKREERPVPLDIKFYPYEEVFFPWNPEVPDYKANYNIRLNQTIEIMQKYPNDDFLIFVTSRARTMSVAYDLFDIKQRLPLETMIEQYQIGWHNAGMDVEEKTTVQDLFLARKIKIVVATPTLAVGVNTPATHVILFDCEEYSSLTGSSPINSNRTQQTIGRAGRRTHKCKKCGNPVVKNVCSKCGWTNKGYAHIIVADRILDVMKDHAYNPLVVKSHLKDRLYGKILRWVCGGIAKNILEVIQMTSLSLSPISTEETLRAIDYLQVFGFIQTKKDKLYATTIGYNTNRLSIQPESVVAWQEQIKNIKNPADLKELFVRFGSVKEYTDIITVRKEDEEIIGYTQSELGSMFPEMNTPKCNRMCYICNKALNCINKDVDFTECADYDSNVPALISSELLKCYFLTFYDDLREKYLPRKQNKKTGEMEIKDLPISNGDRKLLKKAGERNFFAVSKIFEKTKGCEVVVESCKLLSKLTSAGTMQKELVELMGLKKIGIARAKYLVAAGIKTKSDFIMETPKKLGEIMHMSAREAGAILELNMDDVEIEEDEEE